MGPVIALGLVGWLGACNTGSIGNVASSGVPQATGADVDGDGDGDGAPVSGDAAPGDGSTIRCDQRIDFWANPVWPAETFGGQRVCGQDDQEYQCTAEGWVPTGLTPCHGAYGGGACDSVVDYHHHVVAPPLTYEGFSVCTDEDQRVQCVGGNWVAQPDTAGCGAGLAACACPSRTDYWGNTIEESGTYCGATACDPDGRFVKCQGNEWLASDATSNCQVELNQGRLPMVDVVQPFLTEGETLPDWCAPDHHTPWNGEWAFDLWEDNHASFIGATCGTKAYLRVLPSARPEVGYPERLRAKVVNVGSHPYACASQNFNEGGYQQAFEIYGTYDGQEKALGWVLIAHLTNLVYSFGDWIEDPTEVLVGEVFTGTYYSACWGSCHLHIEFKSYLGTSCYANICQTPYDGLPVNGPGAVIGRLGGDLAVLQRCP